MIEMMGLEPVGRLESKSCESSAELLKMYALTKRFTQTVPGHCKGELFVYLSCARKSALFKA